ncbi:hypothetical protein VDGE_07382 [Verticillium dahliae]|uniref:Uncharacterized protein n=1 Tax=Verticillium dahliae TaxID=27337 RepID=A0A444RQU7_VERDA|nr:hypothetical protein VDGE_07382 [Verticillium dahliae]
MVSDGIFTEDPAEEQLLATTIYPILAVVLSSAYIYLLLAVPRDEDPTRRFVPWAKHGVLAFALANVFLAISTLTLSHLASTTPNIHGPATASLAEILMRLRDVGEMAKNLGTALMSVALLFYAGALLAAVNYVWQEPFTHGKVFDLVRCLSAGLCAFAVLRFGFTQAARGNSNSYDAGTKAEGADGNVAQTATRWQVGYDLISSMQAMVLCSTGVFAWRRTKESAGLDKLALYCLVASFLILIRSTWNMFFAFAYEIDPVAPGPFSANMDVLIDVGFPSVAALVLGFVSSLKRGGLRSSGDWGYEGVAGEEAEEMNRLSPDSRSPA